MLGVYKSPKLHFCADAVFLAVFSLLNAIVQELSKSLGSECFNFYFFNTSCLRH